MEARALRHLAPVVTELAAFLTPHGRPDPSPNRDIESTGDAGIGSDPMTQAGDAHRVTDPLEFGVLLLQEVGVGKRRSRSNRDAGDLPEKLDAQTLRQDAVVQILAMPVTLLAKLI